jgi:hypothetical protein
MAMISVRRVRFLWFALAGLLVFAGCGTRDEQWFPVVQDPAFPVQGKIVLPNGKPLSAGRIELFPVKEPGLLSQGQIRPDGTFRLHTREADDGAVPGEYKVRIMIPERREYSRFARYRDEDGSKLVVRIEAKPNTLETIRLK